MKKKIVKRTVAASMACLMAASCMAGCSSNESKEEAKGSVYYLNFKPEQDGAWQNLAKAYTKETGIDVKVTTAAEGTYESTLTAEMDKDNAPTLFQVNGPVGLANWDEYCLDLADTDIYKELTNESYALKNTEGTVKGIAYVIESYGIIYNKTLLQKYCDSDFASVKKIEDINSFDKLKTVAEEIQKNAKALGVKGAFASTGMDSSSDWRFKTHLANLPIYYEYKDENVTSTDAIKGTYLDNYKNIFDLYINNSTCKPTDLASKTASDAEAEFYKGEAVFFQNGSWEYGDLTKNGLKDEDLGMLPIYIGAEGEENQGLCTGSENYWVVNSNASEEDQKATLDFMKWCVSSEAGTKAMADDMGFVIPFNNAKEATNVFVKADAEYTAAGKEPVSWNFTTMPSEDWKNGVGTALTQYAAGTGEWDDVVKAFVDGWKTEYAKANG